MPVVGVWNAQYIDQQYERWAENPQGVTAEWRAFFEGFFLGAQGDGGEPAPEALNFQCRVDALIQRYRDLGHLMACLDPLSVCPTSHPLLELETFGLSAGDRERRVRAPGLLPDDGGTLGDLVEALRETYCRALGVEFTHLQDPEERVWLQERMEPGRNRPALDAAEQRRVLDGLVRAGRFEEFLQKRYLGQTRFSLEGAETLVPLLEGLIRRAAGRSVVEVVLGMAHRGRLSVHVNLLGKSYEEVFCQFEASYDPDAIPGGGDVKYHSGYVGEFPVGEGSVRVVLPENPSHLEAVNPVVEGIARAFQDRAGEGGARSVLPLLVHGDAAFPGQGVVAETLNLSRLEGYSTGGTVHVVLNNQIGYTTLPDDARSTRYATDVAKSLMVPIFHVHGEAPEAALHAARLALEYREAFGKDVVIDLVGYRRHGHNEGDEPYFTQPLMYQRIRERPPVYELYGRDLGERGVVSTEEAQKIATRIDEALETAYEAARSKACVWSPPQPWDGWESVGNRYSWDPVETGFDRSRLEDLALRLSTVPEGFSLHKTLRRVLDRRAEALTQEKGLDWAWAEALAFATLVLEGSPVRLSGEDSRRGTFSQRHSVWFDTETGRTHVPLASLSPEQAPFRAYDSPLSEAAVVGFEYGYSAVDPRTLVLWEAQYGDFSNGAQVLLDQFVASAEAKWQRASGLVLLLPHGYEGQGPDHSTARPERFLQLCAEDNLLVCQPTTPAQYFHLLRRQVKQDFRKPLVVLTPKSLLRHPDVVSPLDELAAGAFRTVLDDPAGPGAKARRVVLCSGKVWYDLAKARAEGDGGTAALARLEQLYPFPEAALRELAESYPGAKEWVWAQEEPRNMGGWTFVAPRLEVLLGTRVRYAGRPEAASPATGFPFLHRRQQAALVAEALGGKAPQASKKAPPMKRPQPTANSQ